MAGRARGVSGSGSRGPSRTHPVRALALVLLAGCAGRALPPETGPGAPQGRAALATVVADNRSPHPLTIEFRQAGAVRGRVAVGSVPAGATRRLAPIPASEPIVLTARTGEGGVLELPARTFSIDEVWVWLIPADAVFR